MLDRTIKEKEIVEGQERKPTKSIGDLFGGLGIYKSKAAFKKAGGQIFTPVTLFEPDWKLLDQKRCPLCGNRLKLNYQKTLYLCRGKKHPKRPFAIKRKTYEQTKTNKKD